MRQRRALIPLLITPLLILPQTGWSQLHDDWGQADELVVEGYLGAGAGLYRLDDNAFSEDSHTFSDDRVAWKAFAGLDFSRVLALEVTYLDFGETTEGNAVLEATSWAVAGIIAFPITTTFAPYGKLGQHYWEADASVGPVTVRESGNDLFFGVGARFAISQRVDMRLEYERFKFDDTELDLASLNLQFRF